MPTARALAFAVLAPAVACTPEAPPLGPHELAPGDVVYGAPGSFSEPAGAGGFVFGAATAATQIEDANEHTDWWIFTLPESEGGVGGGAAFVGDAARGYTLALEDVALMEAMNLDSYRFSIEWARVEPERGVVDEAALAHYDAFIDALVAAGIRPVVTLHHFSNPVWVHDPRNPGCTGGPSDQNLCGWGHPVGGPQVVEAAAAHARRMAERYGDRVDDWLTLNEPVNYLLASYGVGLFPPGVADVFDLRGRFADHVRGYLEVHAAMYEAVKAHDTVDATGDGVAASVGLTLSVVDWAPARNNLPSDHPDDVEAARRTGYVYHHLVLRSLIDGTFDPDFEEIPTETHPHWAGTLDWLGVQYYARIGATGETEFIEGLGFSPCFDALDFGACLPPEDPTYCIPEMHYEFWAPGFYEILMDFTARYPGLPMVVTEAGIATEVGERRAENIVRVLEQVERARNDGADVRGYYHWSLIDNFEWAEGFGPRFGLYHVDYDTYVRTPTLGATVLGEIAGARTLTQALRDTYGGMGPMTPEGERVAGALCNPPN